MLMLNFLTDIYNSNYFGIGLVVVIAILVVLFVIILIFGKKDAKKRKLEETQALEQANVVAMQQVNEDITNPAINTEIPDNNLVNNNVNNVSNNASDLNNSIGSIDPNAVNSSAPAPMPAISVDNAANYNFDDNIVQNVTDNFGSIATSINQELNNIDELKEIKDNLVLNEQPTENNLGNNINDVNNVDSPNINNNSISIETPVSQPQTNTFNNEPTMQNITNPINSVPSSYNNDYKSTPYIPTTQFSSVNVAKEQVIPQNYEVNSTTDNNQPISNMEYSINSTDNNNIFQAAPEIVPSSTNIENNNNSINVALNEGTIDSAFPTNNVQEEPNVNLTLESNINSEENASKNIEVPTQPVVTSINQTKFEMPMLNPNITTNNSTDNGNNNSNNNIENKQAAGPKFAFETDNNSYDI